MAWREVQVCGSHAGGGGADGVCIMTMRLLGNQCTRKRVNADKRAHADKWGHADKVSLCLAMFRLVSRYDYTDFILSVAGLITRFRGGLALCINTLNAKFA